MPVTIRSRLLLLVLSVLLPGLLGLVWLIATTFQGERAAYERNLRDTARALSQVVNGELEQRTTLARVLAQSRWLDGGPMVPPEPLRNFEAQARDAMQGRGGWVELRAPDGAVLLDTRQAARTTTPMRSAFPFVETPQVQPLPRASTAAEARAAVVEPVEREGRVVLNVAVILLPAELQRIVDSQRLPADWFGTVIDSGGTVAARHPNGVEFIGRSATPDLRARLQKSQEGWFDSMSLDGVKTTGYYSTSPQGWTYLTAMPRAQLGGQVPKAVLQIVVGALLLIGLAVGGAVWVSRRIVGPVLALKTAALRMQAGLPVERRSTGIAECDDVASAMAEAAEVIQHGRSDLESQVADAVARTRQAEQRVSQSHRVEALGRLTGGVAHDFNNLLGVISNSAHLIQRHPAAAELQSPVAATLRAVEVGSQLTQHLLRFAGRRPVRPQTLHLGATLPPMHDLLRSALGRRVEITIQVAVDTAPVHVDAGELELAMINLALNARDAMPEGGALRIVARNADAIESEGLAGAPARPYVLIAVGDEGAGIETEVAARVFEPFFTTKPTGKGSGLGLSQVHGFCTQAGGAARIDSTPGLGTTVSLLLPAHTQDDGAAARELTPSREAMSIAGATVLLVDDNLELGAITAALLTSHGATVVQAAHAAEALQVLAQARAFDVVLSDVVMPGDMDGLALARHLRRERPTLPVVLISGFSHAAVPDEFALLRKPCGEAELLRTLHAAIAPRHKLR